MESNQPQVQRKLRWQDALVAVILLSFVFRAYILIDPVQEPVYQMIYALLYAAMTAVTLRCEAFTRETGCKLGLLCLFWTLLCCALQRYSERETYQLSSYLLMMLFSLFCCYALAFVLDPAQARRAIKRIGGVYVLLIFSLACAGLYATVTGTAVPSLSGAGYIPAVFENGRLTLFCYPTAASALCCLALLVGLCLFLDTKRAFGKILLVAAMLVLYMALSLTDSRTSSAFFAACFGALIYLVAEQKLADKRPLPRLALSLCAAVLAMGLAFAGTRVASKAIVSLSAAPSAEAQSALSAAQGDAAPLAQPVDADVLAESAIPAEPSAAPADMPADIPAQAGAADASADTEPEEGRSFFENLTTLQGRTYAWEGALRAMQREPMLLLFGSSPLFVMDRVSPYITRLFGGAAFSHLHSIFFQTLVSYGLPGLILFGALGCYILFHALRLFFWGRAYASVAERALTLLLFFCIAVDLLETFLSFGDVMRHSNPWFFLVAGYVVRLSKERIPPRPKRTPDRAA